jgi:hypothetical protein
MKTHVVDKGSLVDIPDVLNGYALQQILETLIGAIGRGKEESRLRCKDRSRVYVQIEILPYLGLTQGHHNYKINGLPLEIHEYIKRTVFRRNLQSLGISLEAAGPSVHQNLWYQIYFRQVREARALI